MLAIRTTVAQPLVASFIGGGVAGAVSRTVVSPLERLKILFQIQSVGREEYKLSVGKALGKMWREEGWRGFMRGNGTNCVRIVPYSAVQFGSYNFYKRVRHLFSWCWLERQIYGFSISVALTLSSAVLRGDTGGKSRGPSTLGLRRYCRHNIRDIHISLGHCPYPLVYPICFLLGTSTSRR